MKMLLASVALVTAIASPALAQTANGGQNRFNSTYATPYANSYASSYAYQEDRRRSSNSAHDVYSTTGHYLGSDPDPAVRNQLARDPANE
jgi:hypothetical protein